MHTAIPDDELQVFASLKDVRVVVDVGARDDVDYLILKPGIELHAFEPNKLFFKQLTDNVKDTPNVFLNNYGLGEHEGYYHYDERAQAISETPSEEQPLVYVRRLDDYVEERGIKQIDFLKLDIEGGEYAAFKGAKKTITLCRYIQYEESSHIEEVKALLRSRGFSLRYIGGRNYIGTRRGEKKPWYPLETKEGGLLEKTEKNFL